MKTSNYITIAFLTFLFGGVFLLFLSSKFHWGAIIEPIRISFEENLEDFSVVIAESHVNVHIKNGNQAKLTVYVYDLEKDRAEIRKHEVRNDTLFLFSNIKNADLYCQHIKSLIIKNQSIINLDNILIDTLNVTLSDGRLYWHSQKNDNVSNRVINLHASNSSNIQFYQLNMDALNIELEHSRLDIQNSSVFALSGSLKNGSTLHSYRGIEKMNLDVDSSSRYQLSK